MAEIQTEAPPVGEEVHMPEPSMLPVVNAVGITLAIIGITLSLAVSIIGLVVFLASLVAWIRAAAREMSELPLDHSSH